MCIHSVCTEPGQTEPNLHLSRSGERWLEVRNSYYKQPVSVPCKRSVTSHTLEIRLYCRGLICSASGKLWSFTVPGLSTWGHGELLAWGFSLSSGLLYSVLGNIIPSTLSASQLKPPRVLEGKPSSCLGGKERAVVFLALGTGRVVAGCRQIHGLVSKVKTCEEMWLKDASCTILKPL